MPVTPDDVRHVATLARLDVDEERLDHLATELNGILGHMDALSEADTREIEEAAFSPKTGTPLRGDAGSPLKMYTPLASFGPLVRDGFVIVPRLASHEDSADRSP